MLRVGSSFPAGGLTAQHQLGRAFHALSQSSLRLATLKRINRGSDDPAGLIALESIRSELNALQEVSDSTARAAAMVQTADTALGQASDLLLEIRGQLVAAANGTLSPAERSAMQQAIDAALNALDLIGVSTRFGGRQLFDASSAFDIGGVNAQQVADIRVFFTAGAPSSIIDLEILEAAEAAQLQVGGGGVIEATTLLLTSDQGSVTIDLAAGATLDDIAAAVNAHTETTGIEAEVSGGQVTLSSGNVGSDAFVEVEVLSGSFDVGAGRDTGSDAEALLGGTHISGQGNLLRVRTAALEADITLVEGFTGQADPITVSGNALHVLVGPEPFHTAQLALPHLNTGHLGGTAGRLSQLRSGGTASIQAGDLGRALEILDAAHQQVLQSRARAGAFERYTLDSAQTVAAQSSISLSQAASQIGDTDVALESARLARALLQRDFALRAVRHHNHSRTLLNLLSLSDAPN